MNKFPMDLGKFRKVSSDKDFTTLQHADGHQMHISHRALSPKMRSALAALPGEAATPDQTHEMKDAKRASMYAKGGMTPKPDTQVTSRTATPVTTGPKEHEDVIMADGGEIPSDYNEEIAEYHQEPDEQRPHTDKPGMFMAKGGEAKTAVAAPSHVHKLHGEGHEYLVDKEGNVIAHLYNGEIFGRGHKELTRAEQEEPTKPGSEDPEKMAKGGTVDKAANIAGKKLRQRMAGLESNMPVASKERGEAMRQRLGTSQKAKDSAVDRSRQIGQINADATHKHHPIGFDTVEKIDYHLRNLNENSMYPGYRDIQEISKGGHEKLHGDERRGQPRKKATVDSGEDDIPFAHGGEVDTRGNPKLQQAYKVVQHHAGPDDALVSTEPSEEDKLLSDIGAAPNTDQVSTSQAAPAVPVGPNRKIAQEAYNQQVETPGFTAGFGQGAPMFEQGAEQQTENIKNKSFNAAGEAPPAGVDPQTWQQAKIEAKRQVDAATVAKEQAAKQQQSRAKAMEEATGRPAPAGAQLVSAPGASAPSPDVSLSAAPSAQPPGTGEAPTSPAGAIQQAASTGVALNALAIAREAQAKQELAKIQAPQYEKDAQLSRQLTASFLATHQQLNQHVQSVANEIDAGKIDPNRLFSQQDGMSKITMGLGLLLGSMGNAIAGQAGNPALDYLNKAIDRDIDAQKTEMTNKQNLLTGLNAALHNNAAASTIGSAILKDRLASQLAVTANKMAPSLIQAAQAKAAGDLMLRSKMDLAIGAMQMNGSNLAAFNPDGSPSQSAEMLVSQSGDPEAHKEFTEISGVNSVRVKALQLYDRLAMYALHPEMAASPKNAVEYNSLKNQIGTIVPTAAQLAGGRLNQYDAGQMENAYSGIMSGGVINPDIIKQQRDALDHVFKNRMISTKLGGMMINTNPDEGGTSGGFAGGTGNNKSAIGQQPAKSFTKRHP